MSGTTKPERVIHLENGAILYRGYSIEERPGCSPRYVGVAGIRWESDTLHDMVDKIDETSAARDDLVHDGVAGDARALVRSVQALRTAVRATPAFDYITTISSVRSAYHRLCAVLEGLERKVLEK